MNDAAPCTSARTAAHGATYKSAYKPIWCPGCGDYSVLSLDHQGAREARPGARRTSSSSPGIGCSSRIPGLHHLLRLPRRARARARRRDGSQGRASRADGDRGRWRRRRLLDRRQPLPARLPPQRRRHLRRHGQPRVRHDQGTALADHRARLGFEAFARRHRAARVPSAGDRARRRRQLRRTRLLRRPERHRRHHRAGDPASGILVRRGPEPVRHVPARAARLEGAGACRAGGGD